MHVAWPELAARVKRRREAPSEPEFEEVTKRARVQNKDQATSAANLEDTLVVVLRENDYTTSLHLIIDICHLFCGTSIYHQSILSHTHTLPHSSHGRTRRIPTLHHYSVDWLYSRRMDIRLLLPRHASMDSSSSRPCSFSCSTRHSSSCGRYSRTTQWPLDHV